MDQTLQYQIDVMRKVMRASGLSVPIPVRDLSVSSCIYIWKREGGEIKMLGGHDFVWHGDDHSCTKCDYLNEWDEGYESEDEY